MRSAVLASIALFAVVPTAEAQELSHSAPWLGHTLTLELDGLPASAPFALYASFAAWEVPTPFGVLGIDLAGAFPLAFGAASASGEASLALPVPQDAALAELPLHVQAFYLDAALPAGGALVPAAHLRLVGSRFYVSHDDAMLANDFRVSAVSAHSGAPLFELPIAGPWLADREPVLVSPDGAVAAVATPGAIVRFDHFFGAAHATTPLAGARGATPLPGGDAFLVQGELAGQYGLWRVALDLTTPPQLVAEVPLDGTTFDAPRFAYEPSADAVWVPIAPALDGSQRVGLVQLGTGTELVALTVGTPQFASIAFVALEGSSLLVGLVGPGEDWIAKPVGVAIADPAQPTIGVHTFGPAFGIEFAGRLPSTGQVAVDVVGLMGFRTLHLVDLAAPAAAPVALFAPGAGGPHHVEEHAGTAYLFDRGWNDAPDGDEPAFLAELDPLTPDVLPITVPDSATALSAAFVHDFAGTRVALACFALPFFLPQPLLVHDVGAGTTQPVDVAHESVSVLSKSIP